MRSKTRGRAQNQLSAVLLLGVLFGVSGEVSGSTLAATPAARAASEELRDVRFEQRLAQTLPLNTAFTRSDGRSASLSELTSGLPSILVFTYYRCPNLCTLVLNGLVQAMRALPDPLGSSYRVITLSIDPTERSSLALAKKRSYLARYGVTGDEAPWFFLTGAEPAIRKLADAAGFHYHKDKKSGEYAHPSGIVILTPQGRISQYFFGIQFDPKALSQALTRASKGKSGSWVDEILLYCFHYDPQANSHGRLILRTIRIAGILGVFALLSLLIYLSRSSRTEKEARP